jgi:hypothetical protein
MKRYIYISLVAGILTPSLVIFMLGVFVGGGRLILFGPDET